MKESQTCVACRQVKPAGEYYTYKVASGEMRLKSKCKACARELDRRNKRARSLLSNEQLAYDGESDGRGLDSFTGDEREKLFGILSVQPSHKVAKLYRISVATAREWKIRMEVEKNPPPDISDSDDTYYEGDISSDTDTDWSLGELSDLK